MTEIDHLSFGKTQIGSIPEEWEFVRLGDGEICQIVMGQSPPSSTYNKIQEGLPFLQGNMEFREIYPSPTIYCSEPIKIAGKNDVLISVRAPVGEVNISPSRVCIGRGLAAIRCKPNKISDLFLFYHLKYIGKKFESISSGSTFKAIRKNDLDQLRILLPPIPEQKKIAEILSTVDQAIEKVDEATEKTQRLKKGLMQQLLTKGIGHKEFKDTEIGGIPKAWKIMKLRETANVRYGLGQPPALETNGIPMIRATNVKRGRIVREGLIFINPSAVPNSRDPFLRVGDILVVRSGAYTGDVALVTKEWEGAVAGYDLIVTPSDTIDSQFLTYYLLSSSVQKRHFVGLKVRSAQPHLNSSQVEETPISLPPLSEQQKIAEILSSADERLELLRKRKERLERTKKGLMNDLLTGKVRVTSLISEEVPVREIEEIKNELRENMPILRDKYKVKTIGVFGSYIRGEQGKESDIDILVEFYETIDLFTFIQLEEFLSETLGIKVDLVMKDTLKPRIKDNILREAVTV